MNAYSLSCFIQPKGADRKHKTDRDKLDKRSDAERVSITKLPKYSQNNQCTWITIS